MYKILVKVLANQLKKVVGKVVSEAQNAFVEGRQILDAMLITNEVIDSLLRRKESGILCKLDIVKAYDHLNWNFLIHAMENMGFGKKWLNWVRLRISMATFLVLVNETYTGFFRSSRGFRQGEPLCPYLFVMGIKALSCLLSKAVEGVFLTGYKIGEGLGEGLVVSHLLYTDDTLLFCGAEADQMVYLSWLMVWLEEISGLRINLNKSEIIAMGIIADMDSLSTKLGCKVGSLPSSYLGLPLGAPHICVNVWDSVEERFKRRLALWKRQYISKGERLTLIKSTLSSLPIYFMSLF